MTFSGKWAGLFILLVSQIWMNDLQTNNKQHQAATYQNYAQHPRRHNFELRNRTKVRTSESSTMTFRSNKHQLSLLTTLGWRQLPKVAGGFWKYAWKLNRTWKRSGGKALTRKYVEVYRLRYASRHHQLCLVNSSLAIDEGGLSIAVTAQLYKLHPDSWLVGKGNWLGYYKPRAVHIDDAFRCGEELRGIYRHLNGFTFGSTSGLS